MDNISAVIFDFGGVILNIDFDVMNRTFAKLGVDHFKEMYSKANADHLFRHFEEGRMSETDFYGAFRRSIKWDITDEQIRFGWNSLLLNYYPEAIEILKQIRGKYKLFLLSNTNSLHKTAFEQMYDQQIGVGKLEDYFDRIYYSHITGNRKPVKAAWEQVLKENNLDPSTTLFIDDSEQNIPPAQELGMKTIWLKNGMSISELGL